MLRFPLALTFLVWICASTETNSDLNLYTRLLSDDISCDFENITFCRLHNNGGWSFKQSLLDIVQQLTAKSPNRQPTRPNYFVCADWGVEEGSEEGEWGEAGGEGARWATLELFATLPSRLHRREVTPQGKVFYVGPFPSLPLPSTALPSHRGIADDTEQSGEKEALEQPGGMLRDSEELCLRLDVRLSSPASKVKVQFRSLTQSIETLASKTNPARPLHSNITSSSSSSSSSSLFSSLKRKIALLVSLTANILFPSSTIAVDPVTKQQHTQNPPNPPLRQWVRLHLPISRSLLETTDPSTPIPFYIHGNRDVCLDNVSFVLTSACPRRLTWGVSGLISLEETLPKPIFVLEKSHLPSLVNPVFAGAFLFTCVLAFLIGLLIVVFVVSVACGRRKSRRGGKGKPGCLEAGTVTSAAAALLRSPSVSSLPGAAVHQRTAEEILESADVDVITKWPAGNNSSSLDNKRRPSAFANHRFPQKRHPGLPQRAVSVDGRLQYRSSENHGEIKTRRRMQQHKKMLKAYKGLGSTDGVIVKEPAAGQRLSLLLSINEDNELILVPQILQLSNRLSLEQTSRGNNADSSQPITTATATANAMSTPRNSSSNGTSSTSSGSTSRSQPIPPPPPPLCHHSQPIVARLSSAETEATLLEMAESVAHFDSNEVLTSEETSSASSTSTLPQMYEEAVQLLRTPQSSQYQHHHHH